MNFDNLAAALQGKRVFLTGSTGLFGKWILDALRDVCVELVLLSRDPDRIINEFPYEDARPIISFIQGDVRDFTFPEGAFDYVIHAATPTDWEEVEGDGKRMYSVIVEGTKHVLKFAEHSGGGKFLYVSSGAVYGVQPLSIDQLPETYCGKPSHGEYGEGKQVAEQLCLQSGLPVVIARCFSFLGPHIHLDIQFAAGNFIRNCLNDEGIEIKGDGTPLRSFMYSEDLTRWLLTILLFGEVGETYNVGSDEAISIADLARLIRKKSGAHNEIIICKNADPDLPPPRFIPSIEKAMNDLGLKVEIGLEDAVSRTLNFFKDARHDKLY